MREYLRDHRRVFDAGNDTDITTAVTAGFNVDVEDPLQSLRPGHGCALLSGCLLLCLLCCFDLFACASPGWCYQRPVFAVGREHPMKSGQVDSGFGHQSNQPGDEIQWFEYDMGGAVGIGCFELIAYLPVARQ